MPNEKDKDPRSLMTDRKKFMTRSLHTVRIVTRTALYIAARDGITAPTEAVRKACRFLEIDDDYDPEVCPTMRACVAKVKAVLNPEK